jgi:hypothetical protein
MGRTYQETGLSEQRDYTSVSTMRTKLIYIPAIILAGISGFALGANAYKQSIVNDTLKLCNQKQLECKFKYDMVMYEETGKVPYVEVKTPPNAKK